MALTYHELFEKQLQFWFTTPTHSQKRKKKDWGIWMAQSVKHLTLGFGSGHGLVVVGLSPESGSVLTVESTSDSFSLSLSKKINLKL